MSLWIGWDPPFWQKYPKIPSFFYDNTFLEYVRPPPFWRKKSKKISVFSDKEILDWARPPRPPFGGFLKEDKKQFIFFMPPIIYRSLGVLSQVQQATRCHVHLNQFCFKFHLKSTTTKADKVCVHYVSHSHITPIYRKHKHKISSADELTFA